MNKPTLILLSFLVSFLYIESQEYLEMMNSEKFSVHEIQNTAQEYFEIKGRGRGTGYKSFKRWEYNALRMQDENGFLKSPSYYVNELNRFNSIQNNAAQSNRVSAVSNWEELGPRYWNQSSGWNPGVGRITSIAIDSNNANHIIIGSPSGGVWKTTDGGSNWSALTDNLSNIEVYALTIDPVNSSIYYWGSSSGVIFKSIDAGATWSVLADTGNGRVNKILVNPSNTNQLYCSSRFDGIYKSSDGGSSWSLIHTESVTGYDIEFKPGDPSVVYATGNQFFKSTNSGQSFMEINSSNSFVSFNTDAKMIGVSADDPEVVYVLEASGGAFGGFHKSTDGGVVFLKSNHSDKNYFGYSSNADDALGQAPRDMDIAVNPNDADDVHIAGILSWRSTDGGTNFSVTSQWIPQDASNENIGYCHADIDILIYQNNKLYVGSDGGIYAANDPLNVSNSYYTDLTTGLGIRQFYKIGISQTDPVIVSGGSQDNGTSVYRADGIWYDWLGADGMESFVDHSNPNTLYGTSQNGSLYKSVNQGDSVQNIPFGDFNNDGFPDGNWITPFEQDPNVAATVYSGYHRIFKSTNGGENLSDGSSSWIPISQEFGGNANYLKIAPSDSDTMYAAYGSRLFKTTNGGATNWTQLSGFSGNVNFIAIHPTNPDLLAIATNSLDKVYTSTDGGVTWNSRRYNLPDFAALTLVWDTTYDEDILYLGMNYGIYYLRKDVTSWTSYNAGLPNVIVNELEVNSADKKLYAATYGRGLWRVDLFNPATFGVDDQNVSDFKVSPNPSTGLFKLYWKHNRVSIKVYDALGKIVFYEKNRDLSQNSELKLQVSKGLYFLKINSATHEVTKKVIVN